MDHIISKVKLIKIINEKKQINIKAIFLHYLCIGMMTRKFGKSSNRILKHRGKI